VLVFKWLLMAPYIRGMVKRSLKRILKYFVLKFGD
jgi:hypothetical protein